MAGRILLVDDDITALDLMDILFEGRGYEVIRRADGASAIENIDLDKPDIVLIDLMMPHLAGQECVRQMRDRGVSVPIVAFTALDDQDVHEHAKRAGCTDVVVKPCKSSDLLRKIEILLASPQ